MKRNIHGVVLVSTGKEVGRRSKVGGMLSQLEQIASDIYKFPFEKFQRYSHGLTLRISSSSLLHFQRRKRSVQTKEREGLKGNLT